MKTLYVQTRSQWRAWLHKNAGGCEEIWLVYYKKASGKPRIAHDHAVEEALCFGWIDSTIKRMDEARFAHKFTPRRTKNNWSAVNVRRMKRLIAEGSMTAAGREVFHPEPLKPERARPARLPGELKSQFRKHSGAWANFERMPPFYRRMTIGWVASAKKEETRLRRLHKLIKFSARNERLQFM